MIFLDLLFRPAPLPADESRAAFARIDATLSEMESRHMATLTGVLATVREQNTALTSLQTLISELYAKAVVGAENHDPNVLQDIADTLADSGAVLDAVRANVDRDNDGILDPLTANEAGETEEPDGDDLDEDEDEDEDFSDDPDEDEEF